jgi:hypothetical protein
MTTSAPSMAVAMPLWKPTLSVTEMAFLTLTDRSTTNLARFWLAPQGLDVSEIEGLFPDWQVKRFPQECFLDVRRYSWWMTSQEPYRAFDSFEFLTICQSDAVLLRSPSQIELDGCDYIGSTWIPPIKTLVVGSRVYVASYEMDEAQGWWPVRFFGKTRAVGNGGLSTRRVSAFIRCAERLEDPRFDSARWHINEDALFVALSGRFGLRVASADLANRTYLEHRVVGLSELPEAVGFHALERWNPKLCADLVATAC